MTLEIRRRPAALRDIEECFVYIATDNVDIGMAFLVAIEESLKRLSEFPLVGKVKDFADKELGDIRMWPVRNYENYLIFYAVRNDFIEVIRVFHGARNIHDLFS